MTRYLAVAFLASTLVCGSASAAEYFVSPNGKADAAGTKEAPWDLKSALTNVKVIQRGDTIWARAGNYEGVFEVRLTGAVDNPIIVRNYQNERATIKGHFDIAYGWNNGYVWLWGFEVCNRDTKFQGDGVNFAHTDWKGPGCKLINMIIHDNNVSGVGFWMGAQDCEINGCLVYNNGFDAGDRGHGHGFYVQNREPGKKLIKNNIVFRQFWGGTQLYGSDKASRDNVTYEGNVFFNNGEISKHGTNCNVWLGGGQISNRLRFIDNVIYASPATQAQRTNVYKTGNALFMGNYFLAPRADAESAFILANENAGLVMAHNTFYGLLYKDGKLTGPETFAKYGEGNVRLAAPLTGQRVFVRPNDYEPGRANITILNWDKADKVDVDVFQSGLRKGDKFEVRDAQDFYGKPVVTGVYEDRPITIPMAGLTVAAPIGLPDTYKTPAHTAPEFGVFVIMKSGQPE
jgi:hypothetical protein